MDEHGTPTDVECMICYDDIDLDSFAEFKTHESSAWYPSLFCSNCINILLDSQFNKYVSDLSKVTCAREQRALLERGPPINIHDKSGFPESDGKEIHSLWYSCDNSIHSAKLKDSFIGEERQRWWDEQKKFVIKDEKVDEEEKK